MKHKATFVLAFVALLPVAVLYIVYVNFPYDSVGYKDIPSEFFCDGVDNRIDFQSEGNCAAYATAYVLRSCGDLPENENTDENQYNRKLTIEDFEKIWKTDMVVLNNVYIVVDSHNSKNI